ncbi:unnamed protein product, partial [Ectocarpus sp. 8 AP-2014]
SCTSDPRAARRRPCTRRDVDGVDSDLREKISERLPTIEDQEQAAAAAAAASAATPEEVESAPAGGARAGAARVTLNPATLARALPHIRRLMARGSGEGGDGHATSVGGLLGLLQGGGLVFPDARGAASAAMKHGEEKRAYQERRDRLLLLREQKEYQRMIDNIQRAPRETVRDIQASFKFQVGMGANMVVAVFTTFII